MKGKRIIILAHQGLGDLLMAIPLLESCSRSITNYDKVIVFVKTTAHLEVFKLLDLKQNIIVKVLPQGGIRGLKNKVRLFIVLPAIFIFRADILIAPILRDTIVNAIWLKLTMAKKSIVIKGRWLGKLGQCEFVSQDKLHKVDEYLEYAQKAGFLIPQQPNIIVKISPEKVTKLKYEYLGTIQNAKWIALAPGSGDSYKQWSAQNFIGLGNLLLEHTNDIRIAIIGNINEKDLLNHIYSGINNERCLIVNSLGIIDCIALLKNCSCMVVANAGLSHLAAAADIPIIGIQGPSNPAYCGPYSKKFRSIRVNLSCSPCDSEYYRFGCGDPICMKLITPSEVFNAVLQSLNGNFAPSIPWLERKLITKDVLKNRQILP
jgi:ADP-heptose:LPS heptosyltransferase